MGLRQLWSRQVLPSIKTPRSYRLVSSKASTSLHQWYFVQLNQRPIVTKCITGAMISAIGDGLCQCYFPSSSSPEASEDTLSVKTKTTMIDWKRLGIFTLLGGLYVAPVLHVWYGHLSRTITGSSVRATAQRLVLDQLVFAPLFVPSFFTALLCLEGQPAKIGPKLRQDWWPTVQANWTVWIPAQVINFRFVPAPLQVLFSNVIGLVWNSYLSYVSYRQTDDLNK